MNQNNPSHTTEFIEEMKQKLEDERKQVQEELNRGAHKEHNDYVGNFPDYGRSDEENVSEIADYTTISATTEAVEGRLEEINSALKRIDAGKYGITDEGEVIPEDRLRANPAATTLVK